MEFYNNIFIAMSLRFWLWKLGRQVIRFRIPTVKLKKEKKITIYVSLNEM